MIVYLVIKEKLEEHYADLIGGFNKYNIYRMRFREYRQLGIKGDIFGSLDEVFGFIDAKLQKKQRIGKIVKG